MAGGERLQLEVQWSARAAARDCGACPRCRNFFFTLTVCFIQLFCGLVGFGSYPVSPSPNFFLLVFNRVSALGAVAGGLVASSASGAASGLIGQQFRQQVVGGFGREWAAAAGVLPSWCLLTWAGNGVFYIRFPSSSVSTGVLGLIRADGDKVWQWLSSSLIQLLAHKCCVLDSST